jgi:hypothetical protein
MVKYDQNKNVNSMKNEEKEICGAKTRSGGLCQKPPLKGKKRCRIHQGAPKNIKGKNIVTDKAKEASINYGIYRDGILENEKPLYQEIVEQIGTIEQEINMARLKLSRAYRAQRDLEALREEMAQASDDKDTWIALTHKYNLLFMNSVDEEITRVENEGTGEIINTIKSKVKKKIGDYTPEIKSFTRLIARLEEQRKALSENAPNKEDMIRDIARDLRDFGYQALKLIPNGDQFGAGNYNDMIEDDMK